jgi:hypothetical protein
VRPESLVLRIKRIINEQGRVIIAQFNDSQNKFAYFDCFFLVLFTVLAVYVMSASANFPLMMVLAVAMALVFIGSSGVVDGAVLPPAHCNPEVSEALPPRLRRICAALYGIAEISSAVEQYLDDKGICHAFIERADDLRITIDDQHHHH